MHEWAPTEAYFFHVNSLFEAGSPLLRVLLEAAADEGLREVFRLACGMDPTFSHIVAYHEPAEDAAGGGWHRDMQYVFRNEAEEKARILRQGEPGRTWSGMQVQVPLIDGSQHIEYVLGSHARWDTAEEYRVRKLDDFSHRYEDMPVRVAPLWAQLVFL